VVVVGTREKDVEEEANSQSQPSLLPSSLPFSFSPCAPEPHFERVIAVVLLELGLEEPVLFFVR